MPSAESRSTTWSSFGSGTDARLTQTTGKHMRVNVEHRLPGMGSGVEDEPELTVGMRGRQIVRERHDLTEELGVTRGKLDHIAILLGLGDDEQMHGSLRVDVANREDAVGLREDLA